MSRTLVIQLHSSNSKVLGVTSKLYGSFADGFGEILPASNVKRTLKFQFRSNKKKNAGGFRCQVLLTKAT